jgi:phage terminase small subunit
MSRLPLKQKKFVANYILLAGNGAQAVLAAGYNQTYGAARVTAHRLLTKANVMAEIESHVKKAKLNADQVIEELSDIAQTPVEIDAPAKMKALDLLTKIYGMQTQKVEQVNTVSRAQQLDQAKRSYILAALPDLAANHPDWSEKELQTAATTAFDSWFNSLNLNPVVTDTVQ